MKLVSLWPIAFGKFHAQEPIVLEDGLNIILGDNESGKSTLGAFISGMLYGFKKEGRTRISRTPEHEKYRPWSGDEYRGTIVYEHEGRIYRVERWFDPDIVKIYDEITGEDITGEFAQDSRKEYNFAELHLGLSAKEFRNTIWIGQLQSAQDSDLGLEIQGKLENILQGGAEDLSFAKALSVLNVERSKIQTPRSTKGKLDLIQEKIGELEIELKEAREREAGIRKALVDLRNMQLEEDEIARRCREAEIKVEQIRGLMLHRVVSSARELEYKVNAQRDILEKLNWAQDLPAGIETRMERLIQEKENLAARMNEIKEEKDKLFYKKQDLLQRLEKHRSLLNTGLDEVKVSGLHSRYLACKASATRAERHANDARRQLLALEAKKDELGFPHSYAGDALLSKAEELREIAILAEREKTRCDMEIEKARAALDYVDSSKSTSWIYALSLAVLGLAIAFTVMGLPLAFPAFGLSVVVFGIGSYRQMKVQNARNRREAELDEKIEQGEEQARRVMEARLALNEFLALQDVGSVEELRVRVREVSAFYEKLNNAREQYELARRYWFECSQELSSVEKELTSILVNSGCLAPGQPITDKAVERLNAKLRDASALTSELANLDARLNDLEATLTQLQMKLENLALEQDKIFQAAGVTSEDEFTEKVASYHLYVKTKEELSHLTQRLAAILSGRDLHDLEKELADVEGRIGPVSELDALIDGSLVFVGEHSITEKDYQEALKHADELKAQLSNIRADLASKEKEVYLRQREGRPVYAIEEELSAQRRKELELAEDRDALELALSTLENLSRNLRREFAPVLKDRVGGILSEITGGKYFDVRISPDLEMSVIHPGDERQVPIVALSGGTIDQCYFALRVAVAELIVNKPEFPFFLDDSFVQYDDQRLEGVLGIVSDLAKRYQVLLFSCHGREAVQAQKMGIPCNIIRLS